MTDKSYSPNATVDEELDPRVKAFIDGYKASGKFDPLDAYEKATAYGETLPPSATALTSDAKDAARYRWLNSTDNFLIQMDGQPVRLKCGVALDKWIDAAIEREESGNVAR